MISRKSAKKTRSKNEQEKYALKGSEISQLVTKKVMSFFNGVNFFSRKKQIRHGYGR